MDNIFKTRTIQIIKALITNIFLVYIINVLILNIILGPYTLEKEMDIIKSYYNNYRYIYNK